MRLIDADALKTKIQKIKAEALEHGFAPESVCGDILLNFLDNAPTIEAKPVVHAHWINYNDMFPCQCSNCSGFALSFDIGNYQKEIESDFCPHCGAQMDEEVSDDKL